MMTQNSYPYEIPEENIFILSSDTESEKSHDYSISICSKQTINHQFYSRLLSSVLMKETELHASVSNLMMLLAPISATGLSRRFSLLTMRLFTHFKLIDWLFGEMFSRLALFEKMVKKSKKVILSLTTVTSSG
jgi:hypothetical protein